MIVSEEIQCLVLKRVLADTTPLKSSLMKRTTRGRGIYSNHIGDVKIFIHENQTQVRTYWEKIFIWEGDD